MRVETFGFDELAADFDRADREIDRKVEKITEVAMAKIKKGAQRRVRGHASLPGLMRSFSYDVTRAGSTVIGEVGADINVAQGALDHLIENGTPQSQPIPHWAPEADREVPIWYRFLEDAAAEALGD